MSETAPSELAQEEKQMLLAALEVVRRGGHHTEGAEEGGHDGAEGRAEEGGWFDVTKLDAAQRDQVLAAAGYTPAGEAAAAVSSSRAKLGADRATWSPLVSALVQRWQRAALVRARFQKGGRLAGRLGLAVSGISQAPRVWVCGRNNHGQLGLGAGAPPEESGLKNELKPMRKLPVPLPPFAGVPIAHVACGAAHTVVASANHTVFAFGFNVHGELGLGHTTPAMVRGANMAPVPVPALEGVRVASVVCGPHFTLLATREPRDELLGWGQNDAGQLGMGAPRGHSDDVPRPAPIPGLSGRRVCSMSCGEKHSMVVVERRAATAAGRGGGSGVAKQATTQLFAFGGNTYGQLGLEGRTGRRTPTAVPESLFAFEGRTAETTLCITHVAAGANFTMAALRAETPVVVAEAAAAAGAAVEQVRAELGVGARVERSAHVYGWGDNQFRQLALAPDADGLGSATAAVRSVRRLGDPTHVDRPARSAALSGREVSSLACGAAHTLLVTADTHEVWGAGGNVHGSMGGGRKVVRGIVRGAPRDPGTARRDEASVVRKLCSSAAGLPDGMVTATGLETVCAGAFHCVGTADGGAGHVYSWGKNTEGQLGLGNNYARYQPGPQYVQGLPADTKVLRAASMCCATEHTVLFVPFREAKPRAPEPRTLKQVVNVRNLLRIVPEFKDVLEQPKRRQEAKPAVDFEPAAAARKGDGSGTAGATGAEETAGPEPMPAAPEPVAPKAKEKKPLSVIEIKLAGARAKAEAAAKGMDGAQTAALVAERTGAPAPAPAPANVPEGDEFGALDGHDGVFFSPAAPK